MPDNVADNTKTAQQTEVKQPVSIGKLQRVEMAFPKDTPTEIPDNNIENSTGADATPKADQAGGTGTPSAAPTLPTPEQLKEYFKSLDIEYDGDDKLKERLNPTQASTEPTLEQKEAQSKAAEKRKVDIFVSNGGTIEQYVALKNIAEMDIAEFSKTNLKTELKTAGFNEQEIDAIIKERYYQLTEEEIEQFDDETDKEFAKRKKEYGTKKLDTRSSYLQKQAQDALVQLSKVIESEDSQKQNELVLASNIDAQFKEMQREDTYEIGSINGKAIEPIKSLVSDDELATVRDLLKDPAKRNNFLLTKDGNLNITNIANVLAENAKLKAALKVSYHEGSTRTNAAWEKVFPARSAQEIGVGGSQQKPNGQPSGKVASYGKVQRVQPQSQR